MALAVSFSCFGVPLPFWLSFSFPSPPPLEHNLRDEREVGWMEGRKKGYNTKGEIDKLAARLSVYLSVCLSHEHFALRG